MRRPLLLWIVCFWIVAVIVGSLLPYGAKQAIGTERTGPIQTPQGQVGISVHRIYHFAVFGVMALLGFAAARSKTERAAAAGGVFALGVLIEVAQHLYYGNELEWWDIRDDGFGVLAGAATFGLARLLIRQSARRSAKLK